MVVIDGNNVGTTSELDIDGAVPIQNVAGVEVYLGAAQIPAQFGATGTACGLIAIWTRST
jgi:hypothetical protein